MNIYKIAALGITIILLSYAILLYARPAQLDSEVPVKAQTVPLSSASAQTRFFFSPSLLTLTTGETKNIAIMITTGNNEIQQTQIELKYNPSLLQITNIRAGNFLTNPQMILSEHDTSRGRINYVFSESADTTSRGTGQLVMLTLTTAPEASGSSKTYLNFLPKSSARNDAYQRSLLQSTEDVMIDIQAALPQPQ